MADTKPLIAFYGATGPSTLAALAPALTAGCTCTALVRTPDKLLSALKEKGVSESAISNLHITSGNVYDASAVKAVLAHNGRSAEIIISGIATRDPMAMFGKITICEDATNMIFTALREVKPAEKPLFIAYSSTGLGRAGEKRDLPYAMYPLYRLGLIAPHADKIRTEDAVAAEVGKADGVIGAYVIVRPSFLTDGNAIGNVRVGTENEPAMGYTISRDDVGAWVFENLMERDAGKWMSRKVTLTY